MAKKMCPHWTVTTAGGQMCDGEHFPRKGSGCPHNTNSRCEIIPKRKSKVRRVKAWAFVFMGKIGLVQIDAYSDRNIPHKGLRPCTILIEEKYLKEAK